MGGFVDPVPARGRSIVPMLAVVSMFVGVRRLINGQAAALEVGG